MRTGNKWGMVVLLSATATAGYLCRVNVSTAGVLVMKEFGLEQAAMGRIFSAFLMGYALAQVPAGFCADRRGTRRTLAVAAWLWVILTAGQALVGWGPWSAASGSALLALWLGIRPKA